MTDKLTELETLKQRAKVLGITFHPSIGLETLKEKLNESLSPVEETSESKQESKGETIERLKKDALKLVRIRVTCMNPSKKALQGEVYTIANKFIGSVRKYVLFGEPYHVPQVIYDHLVSRTFNSFYTVKGKNGSPDRRVSKKVKEMSIEVLDPLTEDEWEDLAVQQAANKTI